MRKLRNLLSIIFSIIIAASAAGCNISTIGIPTNEIPKNSAVSVNDSDSYDTSEISNNEISEDITSKETSIDEVSDETSEEESSSYESSYYEESSGTTEDDNAKTHVSDYTPNYDKTKKIADHSYDLSDYSDINVSDKNPLHERTLRAFGIESRTDIFHSIKDKKYWAFSIFDTKKTLGIGHDTVNCNNNSSIYANENENVIYHEGFYGITAEIKDKRYLTVKYYSHDDNVEISDLSIVYEEPKRLTPKYTVRNDYKELTADLYDTTFVSGLYAIHAEFNVSTDKKEFTQLGNLYLFIDCFDDDPNDYIILLCEADCKSWSEKEKKSDQRSELKNTMDNELKVDPKEQLNPYINYPYETKNTDEYDTPYWINKVHEITDDDKYESDEYKVLLIHDWMTENLIYDSYIAENKLEARYYNNYDDPELRMSATNIGVCRDFSNVFAIMCREIGIPCVLCSSNKQHHMWNAVYLNDQWYFVDFTSDIRRYAETKSFTDVTKANNENTHSFNYFLIYDNDDIDVDIINRYVSCYK